MDAGASQAQALIICWDLNYYKKKSPFGFSICEMARVILTLIGSGN